MSIQQINLLATVWLFLFGLVIGSFLNVVIARVPLGESIVRPRSRCPHCGHEIPWYENIPVASWLALRGKCSGCHNPIAIRYPLIELLTGILFVGCLARFDWGYPLARALTLVALVIPLIFIDLDHWILPLEISRGGIVVGVLMAIPLGRGVFLDSLGGALLGLFLFWGLEYLGAWIMKQEALGAGDKWLLAMLGAFLGWRGLLGIIFFASLQGSIVGITLRILTGRAGPEVKVVEPPVARLPGSVEDDGEEDDWVPGKSSIPFGPWLGLGGLEVMMLGPWLVQHLPYPTGMMMTGLH